MCRINIQLYVITIIVNILSFLIGCFYSWTSPAIPKLKNQYGEEENPLSYIINSDEESWLASLLPLGAVVSTFISAYAADKLGRKNVLFLSTLSTLCGIVLNMTADDIKHLYLARFFCGLGVGTVFTVIPIFIGEIAEVNNRGFLGCVMLSAINLGIVCTYVIGPIITLVELSYFHLSIAIVFLLLLLVFVPESPCYLTKKNKYNEAYSSLRKLRKGTEENVMEELEEIKKSVQTTLQNQIGLQNILKEIELRRGIIITCSLVAFQQLSGVNAILFFMQSIFEETKSGISPESSAITIGVLRVFASTAASVFVDRLGRKILMLVSCVGATVSLVAFGIYFYLKELGKDVTPIYWLPTLSIMCFMISYALGLGTIPFVVLGEVFPPSTKFFASTLTNFTCLVFTFCTTTFFPRLIGVLGMAYTFWTLAAFCCVGTGFVYRFLPEMKGKTLSEIQEILANR